VLKLANAPTYAAYKGKTLFEITREEAVAASRR
jgi:hypothetical protein